MTPQQSTDLGLLVLGRYGPDQFVDLVTRTEAAGYHALWYADERFFRDCWVSLTLAATHSTQLHLGVCVTDPYIRHPALTAVAAATIDEISGGRMILGLGAGIAGFRELGIKRVKPLVAMRETIELVRALLAGQRVDFAGELVAFRDGRLDVPSRADLPIIVATNGPKMLELAGELADGVIVQGLASETMIDSVREHIGRGAAAAGRDPRDIRLIGRIDTCVAPDGEAARRTMLPGLVRHLRTHHPRYESPRLAGLTIPGPLREAVAAVGYGHGVAGAAEIEDLVPEHFIERFCLAGTDAEVALHVARLMRAGLDELLIFPVDLPAQPAGEIVEVMARQVMPAARAAAGRLERVG